MMTVIAPRIAMRLADRRRTSFVTAPYRPLIQAVSRSHPRSSWTSRAVITSACLTLVFAILSPTMAAVTIGRCSHI